MNAFKLSLMVVAALVCFAFGIYFHSALPEGGREIASISDMKRAPNSKGNMRVSQALQECMSEKATPGKLELSKVVVDGRNWAIVSLDCVGEKAKALYEAVAPFSSEQYVRYSDGRRGVARFFGRLYPPSQCVRVIRTSRGSELNLYSCSVRIDLDHELIESLRFN
jgi:hypothetical protein